MDEKREKIGEYLDSIEETSTGVKTLDWIVEHSKKNDGGTSWQETQVEARAEYVLNIAFEEAFPDIEHFLSKHVPGYEKPAGDTGRPPLESYAERNGVDISNLILKSLMV